MNVDYRKFAKARDQWLKSNEGRALLEGTTSGQYLRNRIELAFIAGGTAAEKLMQKPRKPKAVSQ